MASLQRQQSGIWHLSFRLGGTQFKPSLKTTSEPEARRQKAIVEETIKLLETGRISLPARASRRETLQFVLSGGKNHTKPDVPRDVELKAVVDQYFEAYTTGKGEGTIKTERIHANHLLRRIGPKKVFAQITTDVLQKYAAKRKEEKGLRGRPVSADTIKKELTTFAQIWKMAIAKGIVSGPCPTGDVQLGLSDEKPPFKTWDDIETIIARGGLSEDQQRDYWDCLFLDEEQVLEFVEYVRKHANHRFLFAAVAIAAFTGARRAEIRRSKIEDWDFDRDIVRIRELKGSRTKQMTFREVNLHPRLKQIMQGWFEDHPGGVYTIVVPPNLPRSRVKRDQPSPLTENQAQSYFQQVIAKSKWKVLKGWHVLRHSFCSNCARRSVPDPIIDAWMGHRGDEEIKKRYRHLFPSDKRGYMERLFTEPSAAEGRDSGSK